VVNSRPERGGDLRHDGALRKGGGISGVAAFCEVLEEAAHDFAGARLGQFGDHQDVLRLRDRADFLATWLRSSWTMASPGSTASPRRMTNATTACPVVWSAAPTTVASATAGWETRADSISVVESRCPEMFITSSTRPRSQMSQFLPAVLRSPESRGFCGTSLHSCLLRATRI
jgi:hypothetical protein